MHQERKKDLARESQVLDFPTAILVGATRFELATPCTPCRYATRLRYAPKEGGVYQRLLNFRTWRLNFEAKARQFHSSIAQMAFIPPRRGCWDKPLRLGWHYGLQSGGPQPQYRNSDCVYSDV
jgi:hypothetical protein